MNELLLVVTIAGERVALPAASVESVVELDTLIPVPRAAAHVAGLVGAPQPRSYGHRLQALAGAWDKPIAPAGFARPPWLSSTVIITHSSSISSKTSSKLCPIRHRSKGPWARVGSVLRTGMVDTESGALLVVDVAALIAGPTEAKAA